MSTEQIERKTQEVKIPDKVKVVLKKHMLHVEGPLGKTYKNFKRIPVDIKVDDKRITVTAQGARKHYSSVTNTAASVIKNLCEGVVTGYTVKMKIVFAHFPITVKVKDDQVLIENFQGERSARTAKIMGQTKVVPKGDDIIITGPVLTDVTQTAANIQLRSKVKDKDHRVFLDGIYTFDTSKGIQK